MKRTTIGLLTLAVAGALLATTGCSGQSVASNQDADGPTATAGSFGQDGTNPTDPGQPDRTAEIKGVVVSIDGTTVVIDRYIKDPAAELSEEEKAAKKAERASLSQEERQALKAAENAALETERVLVNVPVGVPISQMVLVGDTPTAQAATLSSIRGGIEITVWTDGATNGGTAEYVKLSSEK